MKRYLFQVAFKIMGQLLLALVLSSLLFSPVGAVVDESLDVIKKAYEALRTKNFKAVITISSNDESPTPQSATFLIYRLSSNIVRLNQIDDNREMESYFLETPPNRTLRVVPLMKTAIEIPGRRVGLPFEILLRFLNPLTPKNDIRVSYKPGNNGGYYEIHSANEVGGKACIQLLVSASDFLPRKVTLFLMVNKPGISFNLKSLELQDIEDFPPGFFDVPSDFRIISLHQTQPRLLRERVLEIGRRHGISGDTISSSDKTKFVELKFLPLLPSKLPKDFTITGVEPLLYKNSLVFHIKITRSGNPALISIFEAKEPSLVRQVSRDNKPNTPTRLLTKKRGDIYALIMSEEVSKEDLQLIADSLREDKELAVRLLNLEEEKAETLD